MAYKANEEGWQYQDRTDAEMAADISKDRNMLDFVAYNNNGYPFVTLAGIMKAANKEGITVESCEVTETDDAYCALVCVKKKSDDDEWDKSFSCREQPKSRHVYRNGDWVKETDMYAKTIAINVAIKNAQKNLLYGSLVIEEMMNDFLEKNPNPPQLKPQQQNGNGTQPKNGHQTQPKSEPIPVAPVDKENEVRDEEKDRETTERLKAKMREQTLEEVIQSCHDMYNNNISKIFSDRGLNAVDATRDKFGYDSNKFTKDDAIDWFEAMCECLDSKGWLFQWMENGGKVPSENQEDKQ